MNKWWTSVLVSFVLPSVTTLAFAKYDDMVWGRALWLSLGLGVIGISTHRLILALKSIA